jgi:hypothetical protein
MTDQAHLERGYRRLLAWYPRAFRAEHGPEILAVLLACAPDGQRRPGLAESADLIRSGLWMRLRPSVPRSARTVRAAVRLICAGAAVSTVSLVVVLAVIVDIRARHAVLGLRLVAAQVSQVTTPVITQVIVSCLVPVVVWLWMARANGQGRNWARILFTVLFGLTTLILAGVVPPPGINIQDQPAASNSIVPPSMIHISFVPMVSMPFIPGLGPVIPVLTGLVVPALSWLAGAAAVCLLWLPASSAFFRSQGSLQARHRAQRAELARIRSSRARWPRQV